MTSSPLSEVAIANFAATTLDEFHLTSLEGDRSIERFMNANYQFARDELLRKYPWAFAKKYQYVAASSTAPPFGWRTAYPMPTDCLRVLPLRCDGKINGAPIRYEIVGREVWTDVSGALPLIYITRVTNPTQFDPLFARALGQYLAVMASLRITGKNSYVDRARQLYVEAMNDAMRTDSLERGTPEDQLRDDILSVRLTGEGGY